MTDAVHAQPGAGARFDGGLAGAADLGRVCAALVVVVDVLSVAIGRTAADADHPWSLSPMASRFVAG